MLCIEVKTEHDTDGNLTEKTFLQKRYDFFQRYQQSHETIYSYLEDVRNLAECCNFYKPEEELLIRDRLVSGLNDKDLQLRVLETYENPTVEDVLNFSISGVNYVKEQIASEKLEDFDNKNIYVDTLDTKEEPNSFLHSNDRTKDINETNENTKHTSRGLNNLFKKHGWAYPECSKCGKSFEDFKYLKGHLVEHAVNKRLNKTLQSQEPGTSKQINCVLCKKNLKANRDLLLHYATHTFSKICLPKVKCRICGKLNSIRYFINHMYLHIDKTEYSCNLCDKKLKSKFQLAAHIQIHKEHSTFVCDICGNKFKRKLYLKAHKEKVHPVLDSKIQALECYLCQQKYKSLPTLKTHINWHSVPRNHLCTQCGERFRRIGSLQKHLMRADHDGIDNRKFQCEICQKKFCDKTMYDSHRYVHTNERPFKCTYENCNKSYNYAQSLKEHYRKHTGEQPYHCKTCDYKCINRANLKRHELAHMGMPRKPRINVT